MKTIGQRICAALTTQQIEDSIPMITQSAHDELHLKIQASDKKSKKKESIRGKSGLVKTNKKIIEQRLQATTPMKPNTLQSQFEDSVDEEQQTKDE